MKKDDVLNILTAMKKSYLSLGIPDPEAVEALEMAIKAVKAEPCEDEELVSVRQELLDRGDEVVSFRQLVERFDEVEEEYKGAPWNLKQIYNNFNILIGEKPCEDAISRQAVLDLAKKGVLISNDSYKSVCRVINDLPSVNPVNTGHCHGCGAKMEDSE